MTAFTLRKALGWRDVPFFYFCSPGLDLWVLAFAVWAGFPSGWKGSFHLWRLPGSLSVQVVPPSAGWSSPIQELWVPGHLVPLALGLSSCCLHHIQVACSYRCRSCSSHPSPSVFFSDKNFGFMGVGGVFGS